MEANTNSSAEKKVSHQTLLQTACYSRFSFCSGWSFYYPQSWISLPGNPRNNPKRWVMLNRGSIESKIEQRMKIGPQGIPQLLVFIAQLRNNVVPCEQQHTMPSFFKLQRSLEQLVIHGQRQKLPTFIQLGLPLQHTDEYLYYQSSWSRYDSSYSSLPRAIIRERNWRRIRASKLKKSRSS